MIGTRERDRLPSSPGEVGRLAASGSLLFLLVFANAGVGQGGDPSETSSGSLAVGEPGTGDESLRSFVAAVAGEFVATRRPPDAPYPLGEDGALPRRIEAWSFVGGSPGPGAEPGLRLRFGLRLFEYPSAETAESEVQRLVDEVAASVLYKAPMTVLAAGRQVYRLDGACTFSADRWDAVQAELFRALDPAAEEGPPRLEVRCGGRVVRRPPPPGAPPPTPR